MKILDNINLRPYNQSAQNQQSFKALHMKKKVKIGYDEPALSKDQLLDKGSFEFQRAVKNFEVLVKQTKKSNLLLPSNVLGAAGILSIAGVGALLSGLGAGIVNPCFILAGVCLLVNISRSFTSYDYECNVEVGEDVEKDRFGNVKIKGNKSSYKVDMWDSSLDHNHYYSDFVEKVFRESSSPKIKDYILNGKIDLLNYTTMKNFEKFRILRLNTDDFQAIKEFYSQQMLTPENGNLPFHYYFLDDMQIAYALLNILNTTETFENANLVKNNIGKLPVHTKSKKCLDFILKHLKHNPQVLSQVLTTKDDSRGVCILDDHREYNAQFFEIIKNEESYKNWVANKKVEFKEKNYEFSASDRNNIFNILEYLTGDIAPEQKLALISKLKGVNKFIDYNIKNSNGVTPLEIILYSEDKDLIKLLEKKDLFYYPELDLVYDGIEDPEFKSKVGKLNLRFKDIEEAIRLNSKEAIDDIEPQLKSPFFNQSVSINIANKALDMTDTKQRAYFFARYMKYFPKYIEKQLMYYNPRDGQRS